MDYFDKAKNVSLLSDFKQIHIGCVAVYKKHIISTGFNTNKTNPIQMKYNKYRSLSYDNGFQPKPKLHAEMSCLLSIKDMDIDFSKVKFYIYRQQSNGELGMSRPCGACMHAIKDLGIKEIYYTTYDGLAKEILNEH